MTGFIIGLIIGSWLGFILGVAVAIGGDKNE